uniref:Uncharacterized protein n=1 Tax=Mycena chlorophos TaxID=658473 RepID=A0ABQ0LYD1_MYCCL|nr:predicted protein [Mycena chlorophos]
MTPPRRDSGLHSPFSSPSNDYRDYRVPYVNAMLRGKLKEQPLVSMRESTCSLGRFNASDALRQALRISIVLRRDHSHFICVFLIYQQLSPLSRSLGLKSLESLSGLARNLEQVHLSKVCLIFASDDICLIRVQGSSASAANPVCPSAPSASVPSASYMTSSTATGSTTTASNVPSRDPPAPQTSAWAASSPKSSKRDKGEKRSKRDGRVRSGPSVKEAEIGTKAAPSGPRVAKHTATCPHGIQLASTCPHGLTRASTCCPHSFVHASTCTHGLAHASTWAHGFTHASTTHHHPQHHGHYVPHHHHHHHHHHHPHSHLQHHHHQYHEHVRDDHYEPPKLTDVKATR